MAGTIDRATLDRLIALGRERGELTASQFQAALPVEALDVDALVLVMLELEAAGVSVEPDAFGPRADTDAAPRLVLTTPEPDPPRVVAGNDQGPRPAIESARPDGTPSAVSAPGADDPMVGRIVLGAGLAVFLILATLLILV
jgi:hypothetical protein